MKTEHYHSIFPLDQTHFMDDETGLTKREYFAAMAMQGLLSQTTEPFNEIGLAEQAARMADRLINALNYPKDAL